MFVVVKTNEAVDDVVVCMRFTVVQLFGLHCGGSNKYVKRESMGPEQS